MRVIQSIQNRLYEIRGPRVMLDFDLAALYEVETKVFTQAVKRNIKRFSKDFMFQLSKEEWSGLRSQIVTRSQKHFGAASHAFTKQGANTRSDLKEQLRELKERVGGHDAQLN